MLNKHRAANKAQRLAARCSGQSLVAECVGTCECVCPRTLGNQGVCADWFLCMSVCTCVCVRLRECVRIYMRLTKA